MERKRRRPARTIKEDGPDPIDMYVGKRIRDLRWLRGLTQTQLGNAIGVKFQQVQKYESGMNHISASRMVTLARALEVPVSSIIGDYDGEKKDGLDVWEDSMTLKMAQHFNELSDDMRLIIYQMIAKIAGKNARIPNKTFKRV